MPKITKHGGPSDALADPDPDEGRVRSGEGTFDVPETDAIPVGEPDDEAADNRAEYEANTADQLREELKERQLSTTGVKADLVDRLVADDAEYEAEERL